MLSLCSYAFRFLVGFILLHNMCLAADINTFFPQIKGDLTLVTWAHAVNNASYLNSTLNNSSIMMIEADIVLGTLNGSAGIIPIMAHPPNNSSDLSLAQFMEQVTEFNNVNSTNSTGKGVKLDFKTIEAFNRSLTTINSFNKEQFPLWINADVLAGPTNSTSVPVNADEFLTLCKGLSNTVLSLGWTTMISNNTGQYTETQINEMIEKIKSYNVTNEITFPVRAAIAANSSKELKKLLNETQKSTLTIWMSDEKDNVNVEKLKKLISEVGHSKVYLDVPEEIRGKILNNGVNRLAFPATISLVITGLVAMFS